MAHKRKDTLAPTPEWAKHLRPFRKRKQAKAERRAGNANIRRESRDSYDSGDQPHTANSSSES